MHASDVLCCYSITTWFKLIHLILFFRGKKIQIAGQGATKGGPNDERSEMIFLMQFF